MTTAQTSTTPDTPPTDDKSLVNKSEEKSIANQTPPEGDKPAGAPEAYEPFKVPEGYVLDEETAKAAGGMFRTMNLSQAQAQELVDFYIGKTNEAVNQPYELWRETQANWVKQVKNDPFLGPRLNQVTSTISKAIALAAGNNAQLAEGFRQMMDYTGAGNNPHFIRLFYEMATRLTEGSFVKGGGPSPGGQQKDANKMPSAASAMYPNLPSAS